MQVDAKHVSEAAKEAQRIPGSCLLLWAAEQGLSELLSQQGLVSSCRHPEVCTAAQTRPGVVFIFPGCNRRRLQRGGQQ